MFSLDIERALRAAESAHAGQARKGDGSVPYWIHPIHAAIMLSRLGAEEETVQAAILHDVIEDCEDWNYERVEAEFGEGVAGIVAELTEDKTLTWPERKRAAVNKVPTMSDAALQVKAADKLHNLSTLLADLRAAGDPDDVWRHFSRGPEQTLAMARELVDALSLRVESGLGAALEEALAALESECAR